MSTITKEAARLRVAELVKRFEEQSDHYHKSDYIEAQVRIDFINPLFIALGWDVYNDAGNAQAYREVIYEDKLRMTEGVKAPDYAFRLEGGKRLSRNKKRDHRFSVLIETVELGKFIGGQPAADFIFRAT